jgi:DNA repair protein RecO (recombination protein O)
MASEKTRAIVIRLVEFSESSCIVTLFTEDFGKIGALAKGARRPKSAFEGALDLLSLVQIVFLHKSSEALDLLTEAKLQRRFRAGQRDLTRLYAGYYIAELLAELTDAGDPHRELFIAADQALLALEQQTSVPEAVLRFELAALREVGHMPSLDQCVACGRAVRTDGRAAFGMTAGGVLCGECRSGRRQVVSVSGSVIEAMRQAAISSRHTPCADAEGRQTESAYYLGDTELTIDPKYQGELRAVMANYIAHQVGRRLRTSDYLTAAVKKLPVENQAGQIMTN